jgi:hypothetical protein
MHLSVFARLSERVGFVDKENYAAAGVCTENLNSNVVVMKSAKDRA